MELFNGTIHPILAGYGSNRSGNPENLEICSKTTFSLKAWVVHMPHTHTWGFPKLGIPQWLDGL